MNDDPPDRMPPGSLSEDDDLPLRRPYLDDEDDSHLALTQPADAAPDVFVRPDEFTRRAEYPRRDEFQRGAPLEETAAHPYDDLAPSPSSVPLPITPSPASPPPAYPSPDPFPQRRRRRRSARERRDSSLYLPWWSLLVLVGVVALAALLALAGANLLGGQFAPGGETPIVIVITATPTPLPSPTPPPTHPLPTDVPGATAPPEGEPLEPFVGATVQVLAEQLNIREGPGLGFEPQFLAPQGSRFRVIGGPQEADNYVWWQVQYLDNPDQQGWAAQEFLEVVAEP